MNDYAQYQEGPQLRQYPDGTIVDQYNRRCDRYGRLLRQSTGGPGVLASVGGVSDGHNYPQFDYGSPPPPPPLLHPATMTIAAHPAVQAAIVAAANPGMHIALPPSALPSSGLMTPTDIMSAANNMAMMSPGNLQLFLANHPQFRGEILDLAMNIKKMSNTGRGIASDQPLQQAQALVQAQGAAQALSSGRYLANGDVIHGPTLGDNADHVQQLSMYCGADTICTQTFVAVATVWGGTITILQDGIVLLIDLNAQSSDQVAAYVTSLTINTRPWTIPTGAKIPIADFMSTTFARFAPKPCILHPGGNLAMTGSAVAAANTYVVNGMGIPIDTFDPMNAASTLLRYLLTQAYAEGPTAGALKSLVLAK